MDFNQLIESYIKSKAKAWSDSTLQSERYRLRGLTAELLTDPEKLWDYLTIERGLKPYAAKTAFIRAGELLEFAMKTGKLPKGPNVLKEWMQENARKFKSVYKRKPVGITFDEALKRIMSIEDRGIREKAFELLATGMRVNESMTLTATGEVQAKGGGTRIVPLATEYKAESFNKSVATLRRHLKPLGLTPHMLRKLCATKARELGADLPDLMARFGWRSAQTASIYLQAEKEAELNKKLTSILAEIKKGDRNGK
jgi:integrase